MNSLIPKATPKIHNLGCSFFLNWQISGCRKGCKSHNLLIYTLVCGERGKWIFLASPCIIVLYKLSSFLCSQIVATTEYFESTRGYCCLKHTLVFLGFKSTKNMNMLQIFDRKCFIASLATIFSARCKPIYIDRSCTLHWWSLPCVLYRYFSICKMVLYYQTMVFWYSVKSSFH